MGHTVSESEVCMEKKKSGFGFWLLVWGLGIAGQLCWNMENQWFNTFIYAKIAKDPTIISWMVAISAAMTTISTFVFGTLSDRRGRRRYVIAIGYIAWGVCTILFGTTEFITKGAGGTAAQLILLAGVAAIIADAVMSFFGSMGNDGGFNAWANDNMTDKNRGQIGAAMATQPVIGTIVGTVLGGILIGKDDNYMLLFCVMGGLVILCGLAALIFMKEAPTLKPHKEGSFFEQLMSVFNFKRYFSMKELVWVNILLSVYFIAFNMYFAHLGNYVIYYLGFTADLMGYIEGLALVLAMFLVIPAAKLINRNKSPLLCAISIIANFVGVLLLGLFVRPENVNTLTLFNPVLLAGVFLIGAGYIMFLQTVTVWSKQLYPEGDRGGFEGIRILFFVLIPMVIAPLISNPVIKRSGEFIDSNGFVAYLPTYTLFLVASGLVLLSFIPLYFAAKHYKTRVASQAGAR